MLGIPIKASKQSRINLLCSWSMKPYAFQTTFPSAPIARGRTVVILFKTFTCLAVSIGKDIPHLKLRGYDVPVFGLSYFFSAIVPESVMFQEWRVVELHTQIFVQSLFILAVYNVGTWFQGISFKKYRNEGMFGLFCIVYLGCNDMQNIM